MCSVVCAPQQEELFLSHHSEAMDGWMHLAI